jgi:MoCo/4Fe-4S cofactor protein with predicted Tat translocation signal
MPSLNHIDLVEQIDLSRLREKLAGKSSRHYWRSLEELAQTPEFRNYLEREFPSQLSVWEDTVGRRRFLQLMAASLALAGTTGCTRGPQETIVPYVQAPEEFVPGKPLYYATAMPRPGDALGLLVESHQGRPTKVEGNPLQLLRRRSCRCTTLTVHKQFSIGA